MSTFVETLLGDKLDILPTTELHIERVHRTLAPKPTATGKPRLIVIKFHRYKTKEVLRTAWEKKDILLSNQRIYFDHDYPATVLRKRKEYNEAKQAPKEKIRFQTSYPTRLRVFYEDGMQLYNIINKATKDMKDRGFPVKVIPPLEDPVEQMNHQAWHTAGEGWSDRERGSSRRADIREKLQVYRRQSPQMA